MNNLESFSRSGREAKFNRHAGCAHKRLAGRKARRTK